MQNLSVHGGVQAKESTQKKKSQVKLPGKKRSHNFRKSSTAYKLLLFRIVLAQPFFCDPQGSWNGACTVCALVHKYISALWAIVIAGFAVLIYCAVSASIRAFLEPAPTDPVSLPNCSSFADHFAQCDAAVSFQ